MEPCFGFKSVSTVVAVLFWVIFVVSSLSIAFFLSVYIIVMSGLLACKGKVKMAKRELV